MGKKRVNKSESRHHKFIPLQIISSPISFIGDHIPLHSIPIALIAPEITKPKMGQTQLCEIIGMCFEGDPIPLCLL